MSPKEAQLRNSSKAAESVNAGLGFQAAASLLSLIQEPAVTGHFPGFAHMYFACHFLN